MKVVSGLKASIEENVITPQRPMKVCMYILMKARKEVRAMRAASALVEAGYTVSVIDVECEPTLPHEEYLSGIRMKHMIIPNWFTARRFQPWFFLVAIRVFILSIWNLFRSQADIYHAHELTALPASFIIAKLRRKPLIFEAYELHLPVPETGVAFWRLLGGLLMRLLAVILPHCQGVIAASPLYAQELRKRYHLSEVLAIRNVPMYRKVAKTERLRQLLELEPDTYIALYQGSLQPNRALEKLVYAARFLERNSVIVMMGDAIGNTRVELEALIASEGVTDRVKILSAVPYEELLEWTASADIGLAIFPPNYSLSIRMTQPNKLFEYLMAGLPVLSAQLDAIVDVIRTYDAGRVVSSLEPTDLAAAINAMLTDKAALERMHDNALKAAQNCCWERDSLLLLHLYQQILAR